MSDDEKPYLYPPPRVLVAPGKVVSITSLPEEGQREVEAQILLVSEVAGIDFCEDDEWQL
jgi:hypothetical protein